MIGTNPFYLAWGGQSNAIGSDGGASPDWLSPTGLVEVWTGTAWKDAALMQGEAPFHANGSNCPGVHMAARIAQQHGVLVRMVVAASGSTEIEQWTGGGYAQGQPIPTDRSVSATNRAEFKKWSDAVAAAGIPQYDALGWWHGEADLDTPEEIYVPELAYLVGDLKALGLAPDLARRFPAVVFGLYTGPARTQQANRSRSLERFVRQSSAFAAFVPTHDLPGRDDDLGDPTSPINHFTSASYVEAGARGAAALSGAWLGAGLLTDMRIEDLALPPRGILGGCLGYRSHEFPKVTGGVLTLCLKNGDMLGETYPLGGTVTIDLDGKANAALGDGGRSFEFYYTSGSDRLTFQGNGRQIKLAGGGSSSSILLTGNPGRGRVVYEGGRYVIYFTAH